MSLIPSLEGLMENFQRKAERVQEVPKIGRTHLQDAVPIRLGQEFRQLWAAGGAWDKKAGISRYSLSELALGGTHMGNGINTHAEFTNA